MIYEDSRYEKESLVYDGDADMLRLPIRRKTYDKSTYSSTVYHVWVRGDTLGNLAYDFWIILDANPTIKGDPTNITPGTVITIPQEVI